jgi:hypothetical protein
MTKQYRILFACLLLALLLPVFAFGQVDRGTITGRVTDNAGAAVPGANVTVTNAATGSTSTAVTSGEGIYSIPALPPGEYKVRVEKSGFKASEVTGLALVAGNTASADVAMEVGQLTETVQITTEAGQVQTENAKISVQVSNKQIDQLPLVVSGTVRSAFDLSLLTPETKPIGLGGDAGTGGPGYTSNFSIGGGQGGTWGVTLDGASSNTSRFGSTEWANLNTPSIDAITEFTVETNGFKAEFGRAQGGTLTFSSKSGTNEYHGNAYEFLRNDYFDARRYFEDNGGDLDGQGRVKRRTKAILKQHDYGGTFGGPVWIPWLYNGKNKTFFFGSFEFFRNRSGAGEFVTSVPTPEMYQGDFSRWVDSNGNRLTIYDPLTTRPNPAYNPNVAVSEANPRFIRDPFPDNKIPANRFSPLAQRYLQYVGNSVHPNAAGAPGTFAYVNNNYRSFAGSSLFPWTKWSVKLDHNFNDRHKISGLYNYGLSEVTPGVDGFPRLPGTVSDFRYTNQFSHVYRANYTWTISPNLINYVYGGVNWWKQLNFTPNATGGWKGRNICLPGAFDCDFNLLQVNFTDGYYPWSGSAGDGSENPIFTFGNDLTYVKGRHTIKGGYLFERLHYNGFGRQSLSGRVNFNRRSTSIPESNNAALGGGNSFASFLLGEVYEAGTENNRFVRQYWRGHAAYIQDDWKVTPRLTINFGLRWDTTLPPLERDDKWSDFDPFVPNPRADGRLGALRFAGFAPGEVGKRTLTEGWYNGFGPRLSFAYSPDEKTSIRAGVGRTFGLVRTTSGSTHFAGAIQIWNVNNPDGINRLFRLDDGFIVNGQNTVPQPPSVDPGFNVNGDVDWWQYQEVSRMPENWNWTLSLQRQLPKNFLVEASYNASVGVHLMAGLLNYNQLPSRYVTDPRIQPLLSSRIDSPAVAAAGFTKPYASFPNNLSLDRALRPFPQYQNINTWSGNGDRSGHSTYHAMILRMERRINTGLYLQGSYVFSKLITDTDVVDSGGRAMDHYNRRWEKSVGAFDLPHNFKFSYVYDLPWGKGQRWDLGGVGNFLIGGWRISGIHVYTSGQPIQLTGGGIGLGGRSAAVVKTLDGWFADQPDNPNYRPASGYTSFYAPVCSIAAFCNASGQVVPQPTIFGQAPRFNGRARRMANLNENVSLQKSFNFTERFRMDFRWELFNVLNRVVFDPPDSNITSQTFGRVTGQFNAPRQMQFGLKLYF